jgi:hypothetical protein
VHGLRELRKKINATLNDDNDKDGDL